MNLKTEITVLRVLRQRLAKKEKKNKALNLAGKNARSKMNKLHIEIDALRDAISDILAAKVKRDVGNFKMGQERRAFTFKPRSGMSPIFGEDPFIFRLDANLSPDNHMLDAMRYAIHNIINSRSYIINFGGRGFGRSMPGSFQTSPVNKMFHPFNNITEMLQADDKRRRSCAAMKEYIKDKSKGGKLLVETNDAEMQAYANKYRTSVAEMKKHLDCVKAFGYDG